MLRIVVEFCFDGISDPGSAEADRAVESLTLDLKNAGVDCDSWSIEEVFGEPDTVLEDDK